MAKIYDVIIIGSGPAGMSAAVYASRAGIDTLLIEYDAPGGKMVKTEAIQNWPGMVSVNGADLSYQMYKHALSYGASFVADDIQELQTDADSGMHTLIGKRDTYQTKAVILATGTQERTFDLPNVPSLEGNGISYCAICDGGFFKKEVVAVFGGGVSAFEEALYLTKFAKKVYLIHRRQEFRAPKLLVDRVKDNPQIELILDVTLSEIKAKNNRVTSVVLMHTETQETQELPIAGMFIYIGSDARSTLLKDKTPLTEQGYVKVNAKMETAIPGVFAAGDVIDKTLRQVVTATNDGAVAAQEVVHYLENL